MSLPETIRVVRWMVTDTFRQAVATKLFWVMLAATATATLVCLSIDVAGRPAATAVRLGLPGAIAQGRGGQGRAEERRDCPASG